MVIAINHTIAGSNPSFTYLVKKKLTMTFKISRQFVQKNIYLNIFSLERFGDAMRHAGVGITVTSLTDVIAFAVGATTVRSYFHCYKYSIVNTRQTDWWHHLLAISCNE